MADSDASDASVPERHERGLLAASVTELIALGRDREAVDAALSSTRTDHDLEVVAVAEDTEGP